MHARISSPQPFTNDDWGRPVYSYRVRSTPTYLWGSAGLAADITFEHAPILHVRNDPFGEPVVLATQNANGASTPIGTLQPGECVSIPIQTLSGISATCATDSVVKCLIKH